MKRELMEMKADPKSFSLFEQDTGLRTKTAMIQYHKGHIALD